MKYKLRMCPVCNQPFWGYPALSRRDNKTEICSHCGTNEAMEDFVGYIRRHNPCLKCLNELCTCGNK